MGSGGNAIARISVSVFLPDCQKWHPDYRVLSSMILYVYGGKLPLRMPEEIAVLVVLELSEQLFFPEISRRSGSRRVRKVPGPNSGEMIKTSSAGHPVPSWARRDPFNPYTIHHHYRSHRPCARSPSRSIVSTSSVSDPDK